MKHLHILYFKSIIFLRFSFCFKSSFCYQFSLCARFGFCYKVSFCSRFSLIICISLLVKTSQSCRYRLGRAAWPGDFLVPRNFLVLSLRMTYIVYIVKTDFLIFNQLSNSFQCISEINTIYSNFSHYPDSTESEQNLLTSYQSNYFLSSPKYIQLIKWILELTSVLLIIVILRNLDIKL